MEMGGPLCQENTIHSVILTNFRIEKFKKWLLSVNLKIMVANGATELKT